MNKVLSGLFAVVIAGLLLPPETVLNVLALMGLVLLVLAIGLGYLLHRGIQDFQDYE